MEKSKNNSEVVTITKFCGLPDDAFDNYIKEYELAMDEYYLDKAFDSMDLSFREALDRFGDAFDSINSSLSQCQDSFLSLNKRISIFKQHIEDNELFYKIYMSKQPIESRLFRARRSKRIKLEDRIKYN